MRLFLAVPLPGELRQEIESLKASLLPLAEGVRWVAPSNYHFTLHFLGEVAPARLSVLQEALRAGVAEAGQGAFPLTMGGVGVFPDWHAPRVLWVGVSRGGKELTRLAAGVRRALARLDPEWEVASPFHPHLTLGRWPERGRRDGGTLAALREAAAKVPVELATFPVAEVVLMESKLQPGGPLYRPRFVLPLDG